MQHAYLHGIYWKKNTIMKYSWDNLNTLGDNLWIVKVYFSFTYLNSHQILNNKKTSWKEYNDESLQLVWHFSTACVGYETALVKLVCDLEQSKSFHEAVYMAINNMLNSWEFLADQGFLMSHRKSFFNAFLFIFRHLLPTRGGRGTCPRLLQACATKWNHERPWKAFLPALYKFALMSPVNIFI